MFNFGVVIWDSSGRVLASAMSQNMRYENPLHVEVIALRFGLSLAVDRGYNNLITESDSMMTVKLISRGDIVF